MNSQELDSQLSAMFDGELPPSECELLSRRIDREESLRARWSRYALIGAAMRSEPVASARSGFAKRVSVALTATQAASDRAQRGRGLFWSAALAASLVAAVAGLSITLLRNSSLGGSIASLRQADVGGNTSSSALSAAVQPAAVPAKTPLVNVAGLQSYSREPVSYVTPSGPAAGGTVLRTQLADYIVAHSEYSTALMRRSLLSALVSSDDTANSAAVDPSAVSAPVRAPADQLDATTAASYRNH